ncbi:DNA-3-methyladenine glycosylase I [Robiginitalea sediminis]|uniref:DNA-3-methyladenine glycosylase I n=1 Tax=Robiginitalea sediminis TaxID=1982593 RepID=UPI000B4BC2A1|nr:DNA-3-methyladenine glycosylase I [Robiginitalea sediminis]
MELHRCGWCVGDPVYEAYHDTEWGVPVRDDLRMFEFLILETFQAGLSWITVLKKRPHFREAFDGFDFEKVAAYDESKIQSLLRNPGIIRNRLKVRAAVSNAQAYLKVRESHGSFCNYFWEFTQGETIRNQVADYKTAPATTPLSDRISKDLKQHGFKFVGSTVVYAHMQATGMVNDHEMSCFRYADL